MQNEFQREHIDVFFIKFFIDFKELLTIIVHVF